MRKIRLLIFFSIFFVTTKSWSQINVSLNPAGISPSSYNLYTQVAGDKLPNPVTNYTSQTVKYTWPLFGNGITGNLYISATGLNNTGIKMTVLVTGSSGWSWLVDDPYGASAGTITVSSTQTPIINTIWSTNNVTRGLTQYVTIDNFALLKAGNKTITVTYSLY